MDIVYFIVAMLAPVSMLAVGIFWKISPPKFRSKGLVYRTALTENNQEAWELAHKQCAKLWGRIGFLTGILTVVLVKFFPDSMQTFFLWLIVAQMALFCISTFLVDQLLKSRFGEDKPSDP